MPDFVMMPDENGSAPYPPGVGAIFEVARRLRAPDGCPWDREQTHTSLRPYLLEETYELLETIDRGDDDGHMLEELGDVLLQVAMHAAIAEETGRFDAVRVSEAAAAKMVARHPHVFGDTQVANAEEVLRNWERQKAEEAKKQGKEAETVLDRVPPTLPALAWTYNMQKRGARVGFDLSSREEARKEAAEDVAARVRDLGSRADVTQGGDDETRAVGELLLAVVTLARTLKVNPEDALRAAGQEYRDHFARMDKDVQSHNQSYRDMDRAQQTEVWARTQG